MDLFSKDQKIALYLTGEDKVVEMICSIEKVLDDRLILNPPQYFMRYVDMLQSGMPLTAKAFSKLGTIDFNSIVIDSPLEDYFAIELDYNSIMLSETEQESYVSAIETMEIKYNDATIKVKTFELSGEYIKFNYNGDFAVGTICDFTIYLPKDYGIINFRGEITERDPIYENEYTATYITMTEKDRQTLIYYMYMYSSDT